MGADAPWVESYRASNSYPGVEVRDVRHSDEQVAERVAVRSEHDVESAHHAGGTDDAVETVESLGGDRAYVIGGAGIYDPFQPVVGRKVLNRIPGEYDGDAHFPGWCTNEWSVADRTAHDDFIIGWVRERN